MFKNEKKNVNIKYMSKIFITFGGGSNNYYESVKKITNQANKIGLFDEIVGYTDINLRENYPEFWKKHSKFILKHKRGYGYWIWKSFLIQQKLNEMEDGDILLYLDSGCDINYHNKHMMEEFFELTNKHEMINTNAQKEKIWTKRDLYDIIKIDNNKLNTNQIQGGIIMLKKCSKVIKLINEWVELNSDYHNIDDSPSVKENYQEFREHRHDQSVYSLLCKKYGYDNYLIDRKNSTYVGLYNTNCKDIQNKIQNKITNLVIIAARNKCGICLIKKYLEK